MKKVLIGLLIVILCFHVFYPCASVIAETLSAEVVDTDKNETEESSETTETDVEKTETIVEDLSREEKQMEEITPFANATVTAHFTDFF